MSNKTKFVPTCTDAEIPAELHQRVVDKLITGRVKLLIANSFFGYLSIRMPLVAADKWVPTAATDGKNFYYNHAFIDAIDEEEVIFLLGHETLHVVYEHMLRCLDRNRDLYNSAADYAINLDLVQHKIGRLIDTVEVLYDTKYQNTSSEDIYAQLFKKYEKQLQNSGTGSNDQSKSGKQGKGTKKSQTGNSDLDNILDKALDKILSGEDNNSENGQGNEEGNGPTPMTSEERAALRDEIREAVLNAAKNAMAGQVPAGVQRMIGQLTDPKLNWRELIRANLESLTVSDYSWLKTSRIGWDIDAILPGMESEKKIDICVACDTSGSISDSMIRDFLGEVSGVMQQFNNYVIHLWTFDTEVYNSKTFTSENLEDLTQYKVDGGGGTTFEVNYEHMKKNGLLPDQLLIFTDGYPGRGWGDPTYTNTLFIIHGNKDIKPPFGECAYYDPTAK